MVYIEDNQSNFGLVVRVLEVTGRYRVLGATDGLSGLALVAEVRPALVIVDLDVPGLNGFEICRRIKASPDPAIAAIPVVALSANVLADERAASLAAGCLDFIEKPFDIHVFRDRVAQLVAPPVARPPTAEVIP